MQSRDATSTKRKGKILMTITLGTVITICITIVALAAINAYVKISKR